ncbi:helix-turn-helix domain-containing protein [Enterococcus entomosocium]|uniref:helix-turn-helix domain-containing protein n=1 Tax=Enterococcus entomosocium TaxID=3034352 RepID=UPI003BEBB66B
MRQFQSSFVISKTTLRWLHLLEHMECTVYASISELSKVIKSSSRTINGDLQGIKEYFGNCIEMKTSNIGYKLQIIFFEKYMDLKKELLNDEPLFKIFESIFLGEVLSLYEWADILFLSPVTLMRYLQKVEPILREYDLVLSKTCVDLIGEEVNIRHFFINFYYESDITPHTVFPPHIIHKIGFDLKREEFNGDFSNLGFEEISYIIYIILERTSHGHYVSINTNIIKLFRKVYYCELKKIQKMLSIYLKRTIPEKEIIYFYVYCMCKRTIFDIDTEKKFCDIFGKDPGTSYLTIEYMKTIIPPNYAFDYSEILIHSFFSTIMLKNKISPILNKVIPDLITFVRKQFPEEMEGNVVFLKNNLENIPYMTLETLVDISAVFTIHMDCLREMYWGKPKKIVFLLEGNQFVAQRIQVSARKFLGSYQQLYFPDVLDIDPIFFETNQFDIIVTNYNEYMLEPSCSSEYLLFNKIPNLNDWYRLIKLVANTL